MFKLIALVAFRMQLMHETVGTAASYFEIIYVSLKSRMRRKPSLRNFSHGKPS